MNTEALISYVPAEMLLGLGLLFGTAAIVLLALSVESGRYPEFRQWLSAITRLLPRRRLRRRWHFNTCSRCSREPELACYNERI